MNKFILITLAVLSSISHAALGGGSSIRLTFEESKINHGGHIAFGSSVRITVDEAGLAKGIVRIGGKEKHEINLKVFLKNEMAEINHLIDAARAGEQEVPNPSAPHCLAMPSKRVNYSADETLINLYSAEVPCGTYQRNVSPEAVELVSLLNELIDTLHSELDAQTLRQ